MKKIIPQYSKSEVNKAGKILIDEHHGMKDFIWAFDVMNNWRASHDYPINTFQANLRNKIKEKGIKSAIVVQRLKRVPSIIFKLSRYPSMNLSRMQDLGGLRAIVNTVKQVNVLNQAFKDSRFHHKLIREYDYIREPKTSGYRGIHLIYKYANTRAPEYNGLQIEIQLRTKLQHAWATAVETMGTFLDHSLKSSEGPEQWLMFFSLCSSAFAHLEKCPAAYEFKYLSEKEIVIAIKKIDDEVKIVESLRTFGSTVKAIETGNMNYKYYLLILDVEKHKVKFEGYHSTQLEIATQRYLEYEKELGKQTATQIVLVSGDSFKSLKRAYPNYFLDTHQFTLQLRRLFEKHG